VDLLTRSPSIKKAQDYIDMFTDQFHPQERAAMLAEPTEAARYVRFFVNWSLKEAFIKAIGLGLGFDLQKVYI